MVNEGIINLGNAKLISLDPNISISCLNDIKFLTSDTEKMRIDSSGNVGIGITNPSEKLVLSKNIGLGPNFQLQNIDNMERVGFDSFSGVSPSVNPNTSSYLNFSSWPDNWFPRQFLYINRDIDKQYTSSGPDLQNDLAIEFGYSNYFYRSGEINPPSAYYPAGSAIRFHTANNNSTLTEKMCIDYQGNIGIGTTNPTSKLHVNGDTNIVGNLKINDSNISIDNLDDVTVSGTPVHNDVLSYQSGQWTNRTMHNRNYQYASSTSHSDTSIPTNQTWIDVNGMATVSIIPTSSSSSMRISVDMYFEVSSNGHELLFRLVRQVNGQPDVYLNTTNPTGGQAYTLGVPFQSRESNNETTVDGIKFKFIETPGTMNQITYKVQCRFPFTTASSSILHLNSTVLGGTSVNREYMTSWIEVEEISNGPPLTTNNVAVSGTPVHNDVLTYQSGQWTNTSMHTRNYQYKQINDFVTTNYNNSFTDIGGFTGSNLLQITTLRANSKVRVHFIIRGESANPNVHDLQFNLVRRVNGANPTDLNANLESSYPNQTATLANVEISAHQDAYHTMDTVNIYYIDSLDNVPAGSVVSYTPQLKDFYATSGNTFRLNSVDNFNNNSGQFERTISISEAEEMLTGPPLTTNNVAVPTTNLNNNDVLSYQSGQWTNTAMHTRNYQYKQQTSTSHSTSLAVGSFNDLQGFTGTDALQITTLQADSTVRIHFIFRGEPNFDNNYRIMVRLQRTINSGSSTYLNAPDTNSFKESLAVAEQGYYIAGDDDTADTYEVYYVDTLPSGTSAGSVVKYVPQLATSDNSTGTFYLNRTRLSGGVNHEAYISIGEAEEILTGPPLTTNNVAVPTTNLNNNDVLSYQSGQWTNTSMHSRNYQYKHQTSTTDTTTVTTSFLDINGLDGSDALQITTLQANSKIRLHYTIRGELSNYPGNDLMFQLKRSIGGTNTDLNAPTVTGTSPSLAVARISQDNQTTATMDTWEIYYVDTLVAAAGTTVTYTPQIRLPISVTAVFHLNRTVSPGGTHYENSISFYEAEEILTGPPLQINSNVVTATPNVGDFLKWSGSAWVASYPTIKSARFTWGHTAYLYHSNGTLYTLQFRIQDYSGGDIQLASNYTDITMQPGRYLIYFDYPYRRPNGYADRVIFIFKKNGGYTNKIIKAERYCNAASHNLGNVHNAPYDNVIISGIIEVSSTSDIYTATIQGWTSGGVGHLIPNTADTMNAGYIIRLF